jgi:hypothetical protein
MFKRLVGSWQLWIILIVIWTVATITSGWMNLPRARQLPHDPQLLSKLSREASSILFGTDAQAGPPRGALVWSESPRTVRMSNGTRLAFPATTTGERVAFVRGEYFQLLDAEADERRGPYLLKILAIWFAAVLLPIAILAVRRISRGCKSALNWAVPGGHSPSDSDVVPTQSVTAWRSVARYVRQRTEKMPVEGDNDFNDGTPANRLTE